MSLPSQKYVEKVVRWSYSGVALDKMNMNPEQKFRAQLCVECYRLFVEDSSVPIRTLVKNVAARDYSLLMKNAEMGMEEAQQMVAALGIRRHPETGAILPRSETAIANDIWVIDQLTARLNLSKKHIHRLMVEDDIDWLRDYGRQTGTWQAVNKAADKIMKLNNDFKDDDDPQEQMPDTDINITGDVSVVKQGRSTLSDEEKERLRRKYGLTEKEYAQELEEINGVWQAPDPDEPEKDIYETMEEKAQ